MSMRDLTTSIVNQEDFFAGVYEESYTRPWSQIQLVKEAEQTETYPGTSLKIGFQHAGPKVTQHVAFDTMAPISPRDRELLWLRFHSYLLLSVVPGRGLWEVMERLNEIIEFYTSRKEPQPTLPAESPPLRMEVVETRIRPALQAVEE